jgi:hypothetical protein
VKNGVTPAHDLVSDYPARHTMVSEVKAVVSQITTDVFGSRDLQVIALFWIAPPRDS